MDVRLLLSIGLGLGLAAANGLASLWVLKRAVNLPNPRFIQRIFGSLGVRMVVLLLLMGLILWLVPVHVLGFAIAFVIGLLIALGIEMWIVLRWARTRP